MRGYTVLFQKIFFCFCFYISLSPLLSLCLCTALHNESENVAAEGYFQATASLRRRSVAHAGCRASVFPLMLLSNGHPF